MLTRIRTVFGCLPWRRIGYTAALAIWSVAWGLGAAAIYCRRELAHYVPFDLFLQGTNSKVGDWLDVKHITLLDSRGEMAGWLDADGLTLYHKKGELAASLDTNGFTWWSNKGKASVSLTFNAGGSPTLSLSDSGGKDRLVLGSAETVVERTGEEKTAPVSSITLFGKDGRLIRRVE